MRAKERALTLVCTLNQTRLQHGPTRRRRRGTTKIEAHTVTESRANSNGVVSTFMIHLRIEFECICYQAHEQNAFHLLNKIIPQIPLAVIASILDIVQNCTSISVKHGTSITVHYILHCLSSKVSAYHDSLTSSGNRFVACQPNVNGKFRWNHRYNYPMKTCEMSKRSRKIPGSFSSAHCHLIVDQLLKIQINLRIFHSFSC